jgi:hypothetical protein
LVIFFNLAKLYSVLIVNNKNILFIKTLYCYNNK